MFATGYRAVHNPLPALSLHLKTYGLLAISDKDDADFTHARLVCVSPLLSEQLHYYEDHLRHLAELIRYRLPELAQTIDRQLRQDELLLMQHPTEAADWYKTVKKFTDGTWPAVFISTTKRSMVSHQHSTTRFDQ